MKDISFHILDIVRNSVSAGAGRIEIELEESTPGGTLKLTISDNGKGMTPDEVNKVSDPFFTSSVAKKVGLGIPLLKQNAEQTGGTCRIESEPGKGTTVTALFNMQHIDMLPMGDLAATMRTLIATDGRTDFVLHMERNGEGFMLDTAEIKEELEMTDLRNRDVLHYIDGFIQEGLQELKNQQNQHNVS